ncbi:hypothetical protein ME763_31965 [Streptomyces murinus]|uniref:hypothetical protein n=1 Tax=Streptomyces murinus TaxID=33900 RepID=UPI00117C2BD6|nr:hypothetical protein [Streptomyces murinus]WDO09908.1 hypothetical protein ME763_31965 [Streptomyces murinus]
MTATLHISRRTTQHHPLTSVSTWWANFRLRHSQRALDTYVETARLALPAADYYRHAWENPVLEAAFAGLAADHPEAVTPSDGGMLARDADREQLLLAVCDLWFRDAHPAPEYQWAPEVIAAHQRLMNDIRTCFHPTGGAA